MRHQRLVLLLPAADLARLVAARNPDRNEESPDGKRNGPAEFFDERFVAEQDADLVQNVPGRQFGGAEVTMPEPNAQLTSSGSRFRTMRFTKSMA